MAKKTAKKKSVRSTSRSSGKLQVFAIPKTSAKAIVGALQGIGSLSGTLGAEAGGTLSGTNCSATGPKLSPNDFNCSDSDD